MSKTKKSEIKSGAIEVNLFFYLILSLLLLISSSRISFAATTTLLDDPTLNVQVTPSRTDCVAPCGVFFDGLATTSTQAEYSEPFRQLDYTWDFGDPQAKFINNPNVNVMGTDQFTYKANDGALDSNVATVTILIGIHKVTEDPNHNPDEVIGVSKMLAVAEVLLVAKAALLS